MAKTRWYQERRRDPYFRDAKREGYRARSAYKLKQVQKRFRIVRPGDTVVDLGAAPGGWSQVLAEIVGPMGAVFAVDLRRIAPLEGVTMLKGDFTARETHARLAEKLHAARRERVDAVVSDMAPDMSGNYTTDQARSVFLAEMALDFATRHLRAGGAFLCKVFEGADFQAFREEVRARFRRVMQFHPPASRKQSSEVYLVAMGFQPEAADEAGLDAEE